MDLSGNVNAKQDNKANVIATVVFIPLNSVSDRKEYIDALIYAQQNNYDVDKLKFKFKEWQDSFYKEIEKYI